MQHTILRSEPLTTPWPGTDPFLFCANHTDHYPKGTLDQGVSTADLGGRLLGNDFSGQDGFNMYYGTHVPGFPAHPHRGFETVTIVPHGLVDHADSLGATARYGDGDVQWLTAGKGIMHAEMFPLRDTEGDNPFHLFQIWLNLPARDKMVEPAFTMLWNESIPRYHHTNGQGARATVKVIAGAYAPQDSGTGDVADVITPPPAAPDSWASKPEAELAIWQITLEAGASLTLPAAHNPLTRRTLYFHSGESLKVAGSPQSGPRLIEVHAQSPLELVNTGQETAEIILMQAVPLNEPVVAQGPFVMNTQEEIQQARRDFAQTQFGGWPWSENGPVHPRSEGRFAQFAGSQERQYPSA